MGERPEGREKEMEPHFTFLNRRPATHGFCLLLQRLCTNSVYLEKEGRKIFPFTPGFRIIVSPGGRVRPRHLVWKLLTRQCYGAGGSIFNIF